jgi:carboxyl-terminal processing protease
MRTLLAAIVVFAIATSNAAERGLKAEDFKKDFDYAWTEIGSTYAYFDSKTTVWSKVPALYGDDLKRVKTREQFIDLLERLIDELYDPHAQLNTNLPTSYRLVPSGTDLWAEWRDGKAVISQVRAGTDAARAGIKPNAEIVSINNQDIATAVEGRMGRAYAHSDPSARDWALRSVLAGRHNTKRILTLRVGNTNRVVELPAPDQFGNAASEPATHSEIRPGIGYIRLNDSLGNDATVAAFDRALSSLRATRGLIVDLRSTASGGNSTVARGILGRFIKREAQYQKHELSAEGRETGVKRSWIELVSPRGEFTYEKPVAVLVDHWTGSMGEGIAIGFDAICTCKVVGTPMARLVGATYTIALPQSGIHMNVPAERVYHVNGTPRESYLPVLSVDVGDASDDPFIAAALRSLDK